MSNPTAGTRFCQACGRPVAYAAQYCQSCGGYVDTSPRPYGSKAGSAGNLLGMVMAWLYSAFMESSIHQATPGKMALGIVVTDANGDSISFGRATGRHFGKIISGLILGIGYLMAGFTERKQGLHDMMADCLVVCKRQ